MLPDALRAWLDAQAEALDAGNDLAPELLPRLAGAGVTRTGVTQELGGQGGDIRDAVRAVAALAAHSLAAGFAFWGHRVVTELLLQTANAGLRARWLPQLLRGERAGASGLSNVMKFLSGIESLNIRAEPDGAGRWRLQGHVPWCTNLRRPAFLAAMAVARSDGAPPMVVALPSEQAGLLRSDDLDLIALRGTNTASLRLDGVVVTADDLLAEQVPQFLPQARPAFMGLQCGLSIGLARAALRAAAERAGAGRHVLAAPLAQARQALDAAEQALLDGLAAARFGAAPRELFGLRLRLNEVVQQAVQLELQASGGLAYHRDRPGGFARRWREAAFIPIVTPSVTQLMGELDKQSGAGATAA